VLSHSAIEITHGSAQGPSGLLEAWEERRQGDLDLLTADHERGLSWCPPGH